MPPASQRSPVDVGILLYAGCQMGTVHGMSDLLQIANRFSVERGGPSVRVTLWGNQADGNIERCDDGHPSLDRFPGTFFMAGRLSGPAGAEEAAPYARWLLERHAEGATLTANCAGTFLLASTGLLDGRRATTHWLFANEFRDSFPNVHLDPDRIVVEDGELITSGGSMAWTDLGLRLVDRLLGPTVMIETGRFLLIDPAGREQRHYSSFAPRLTHGDETILKVQHWLHARGTKAVTVPEMAQFAALEQRTFLRRFKAGTGMTPTEYSQHLRIGKARELLEFTKRPVDQVAYAVGYEDSSTFRRLFHRIIGLSPGEYRLRFTTPSSTAVAA